MENICQFYTERRSYYNLNNKLPISQSDVENILRACLLNAPSAYNSQSGRIVLLLDSAHQKLWHIVLTNLQKVTSADSFKLTQNKIASFSAAYGTILFFEDTSIIKNLQQQFSIYQSAFPKYSYQSSGMLQFMVWTALSSVKVGASLQHYNPLIDNDVQQSWNLPQSWLLISQMPFGGITSMPEPKSCQPLDYRLKIITSP